MSARSLGAILVLALLPACGSQASSPGAGPGTDAGQDALGSGGGSAGAGGTDAGAGGTGASPDAAVSCDDKAKGCVSSFGSLFTKSDGRADGTLVALVRPVDQQCAMPNGTHAVLELSIQGQVQRLVTSVDGVAVTTVSAPLLGPAYAEGWHQNVTLDYPTDLGAHSTDFSDVSLDDAVSFLCSHLTIGAEVSVYAYSDGTEPSSAHQIHRNDGYSDGAIVVDPTSSSPTWLLFRYLDQTF